MALDLTLLFEELAKVYGSPHDYNHILSLILQNLNNAEIYASFNYINGTPYTIDPTRGKLLSVSRPIQSFARYGGMLANCYMKLGESTTAGEQGLLMIRAGTITALSCKSRHHGDYYLEVRRNGSPITLTEVRVQNGIGTSDNLNIDFDQNDYIQLYIRGSYVDHPIASLEWAWRS